MAAAMGDNPDAVEAFDMLLEAEDSLDNPEDLFEIDLPDPGAETEVAAVPGADDPAVPSTNGELIEALTFEVNGEEIQVTADEYADNWATRAELDARERSLGQRESQFATQEQAARNALELVGYIEQNPHQALPTLAREFGVAMNQAAAAPAQAAPSGADPYWSDPTPVPSAAANEQMPAWAEQIMNRFSTVEQTVNQIQSANGQLAAIERDRVHRSEFDELSEQYPNNGVSYDEVSAHWRQHRFPTLAAAFSDLALPRMREHQQRAAAAATERRSKARKQTPMARSGAAGSRGEVTPAADPAPQAGVGAAIDRALATRRRLMTGRE